MKKILFLLIFLLAASLSFGQSVAGTQKWRTGITYSAGRLVEHAGVLYKSTSSTSDMPPSANWLQVTEVAITQAQVESLGFVTGAHTVDTDTQLTGPEVLAFVAAGGYTTGAHFTPSTLLADYSFTDNSANWDAAFGWGDHALAGYSTGAHTAVTDITLSGRTGTQWQIDSSTGTDAILSSASTTLAGLMSATDKTKLDGLSMQTLSLVGADLSITGGNTVSLSSLTGATNLAFGSRTGTQGVISSDTGTDATITSATTTLAGFMSATDKTKLDGLSNQTLSLAGNDLSISGGNTVDLSTLSPDLSNYVNLDGAQTITGDKTFDGSILLESNTGTSSIYAHDTSGSLYFRPESGLTYFNQAALNNKFFAIDYTDDSQTYVEFSANGLKFVDNAVLDMYFNPNGGSHMIGNLTIGSTTLGSERLNVTGNISATGTITGSTTTVNSTGWENQLIVNRAEASQASSIVFQTNGTKAHSIVSSPTGYFEWRNSSGQNIFKLEDNKIATFYNALYPAVDASYDLGSSSAQFRDGYLSGTINLGNDVDNESIIIKGSLGSRYGVLNYSKLALHATSTTGGSPALSFDYVGSRGRVTGFKGVHLETYQSDATFADLHLATHTGALTASAIEQRFFSFYPNVTQTGTANYVGLMVDATENSTGSGENKLMDLRVGGASQMSVSNTGDIQAGGEIVVEGAATLKTLKRVENANTAITITAADFGTFIYCTAGTAVTITIPDTLSPVDGQTFSVAQWGAGQVTIVGSGTTTIVSTSATHKTSEQYAVIQLDHIGSNTDDWHAWGGLENN